MESNKKHLWSKNENLSTDNTGEIAGKEAKEWETFSSFVCLYNGYEEEKNEYCYLSQTKVNWIAVIIN